MWHGENPVMMELEEDDAIQTETDWWMQETHSADVAFDNQKSALQGNGSDIDGFGADCGKQGCMASETAYADRVNNVDNWREESGNWCENQISDSAAACFTDGMPGAERKSVASSETDGPEAAEWTSEGVSALENRAFRGAVERDACKAGSHEFMDKEVEAMWRSAFERTSGGECGAGLGQPGGAGPEFPETNPLCGEMRDSGFVTGKAAGFWNSECNDTDTSETEYVSKTEYMENNADDIEFYNINQSYQSYQLSQSYQSCQYVSSDTFSREEQPGWEKERAAHGEMGLDGQNAQSREWNLPKNQETSSMENKMDSYREIIRDNISYACFQDRAGMDDVDELVELMVDTMMVPDGRTVRVGGQDRPASIVKGRFMKLAYGAKRARYNSSLMDANVILPGDDVELLPENYVIFITEGDLFRKGLPVYHIDRIVEETGMPFGDASHILYVNGAYRGDDPIGRLMHDFSCTDADDMNYGKLSERVRYFKETEEGVKAMSKAMEELAKRWAEEEIQERNEEVALELLQLGRMDYEEIASVSKLSVETVERLAGLQPV